MVKPTREWYERFKNVLSGTPLSYLLLGVSTSSALSRCMKLMGTLTGDGIDGGIPCQRLNCVCVGGLY